MRKSRWFLALVLALTLWVGLPASAHHANTCSGTWSYSSIPASWDWSGNCHCDLNTGRKFYTSAQTSGFGFLDSTGNMSFSVGSQGIYNGGGWSNTEFDQTIHKFVTSNWSIIQSAHWSMSGVFSGGDAIIKIGCTTSAPGMSWSYY